MDIERSVIWFTDYVREFVLRAKDEEARSHLELKKKHSLLVLEEALALTAAADSAASPELARQIHLAALFHDIGRFSQYEKYATFRDVDSVNHGRQGCRALKRALIPGLEDPATRAKVRTAVLTHNRKFIPRILAQASSAEAKGQARFIALAVRDCDKLDIMRIMLEELEKKDSPKDKVVLLGLTDVPDRLSPAVLRDLYFGRMVDMLEMRYVNDFVLLLLSWVFDLNFPHSRREFRRRGFIERLMAFLPPKLDKSLYPMEQEYSPMLIEKALLPRGC